MFKFNAELTYFNGPIYLLDRTNQRQKKQLDPDLGRKAYSFKIKIYGIQIE